MSGHAHTHDHGTDCYDHVSYFLGVWGGFMQLMSRCRRIIELHCAILLLLETIG